MKALDTYQMPEGMPVERHPRGGSLHPRGGAATHCDYDVLGLALILAS